MSETTWEKVAGVARQLAERKGFRIVGAVDIDPTKWVETSVRSPGSTNRCA